MDCVLDDAQYFLAIKEPGVVELISSPVSGMSNGDTIHDCHVKVVDDSGDDVIDNVVFNLEGGNLVDYFPTESRSLAAECYGDDMEKNIVLHHAADHEIHEVRTSAAHDTVIAMRDDVHP